MNTYCPDDKSLLQSTGVSNQYLCPKCKCTFEIQVSALKKSSNDSRSPVLPSPPAPVIGTREAVRVSGETGGSGSHRWPFPKPVFHGQGNSSG